VSERAKTRTLASDPLGGVIRRTVLPGGLRVISESVPAMRSVSVGVWVGIGSRDESPTLAGASHFLEHLLFKGTRRRTALDIPRRFEAVGGETNAFTTKEYTCYYARCWTTTCRWRWTCSATSSRPRCWSRRTWRPSAA